MCVQSSYLIFIVLGDLDVLMINNTPSTTAIDIRDISIRTLTNPDIYVYVCACY